MIIPDKKKKLKNEEYSGKSIKIYVIIGCIIIFLFILFQPKLSSQLFPQKKQYLLNKFLTSVEDNQTIDPRVYWEFREFYSPGYFDFSIKGLDRDTFAASVSDKGLRYKKENINRIFLKYNSPLVRSYDILTEKSVLSDVISPDALEKKEIIFQNPSTIVYKERSGPNKGMMVLLFLKSLDEMKKANGFFDYRDVDKELVRGKNWVNITTIYKP